MRAIEAVAAVARPLDQEGIAGPGADEASERDEIEEGE